MIHIMIIAWQYEDDHIWQIWHMLGGNMLLMVWGGKCYEWQLLKWRALLWAFCGRQTLMWEATVVGLAIAEVGAPWKEISHRVSGPSVSGWDGAANGLFTESNTRKFMVHVTPGITEKVSKRKQSVLAFLSVTTVSYHIWGDTHTKDQMLNLGTWQAMLTEQLQTLNPPRLYKDHDSSR